MNDLNKTIAVGDTVRINEITGPQMMVFEIIAPDALYEPAGHVRTMWFSRRGEIQYGTFDPRLLFKCPPRERMLRDYIEKRGSVQREAADE